jgi:23S rRNA (pseudouridine1915-N3)-methyltransferase
MKILFVFGGGKYDADTLPLSEHFLTRILRHTKADVVLVPETGSTDDSIFLRHIKPEDTVLLCDERGTHYTSPLFATLIDRIQQSSTKRLVVVVGGAHGVSDVLRGRADYVCALSSMVFPHQLARIMILEQVYRAHAILAGTKYHHE